MKILSFGDLIEPGDYSVFSRFNNILNFVWNERIISLGNQTIQKGPTNIIIDHFDFQKISSLSIIDNFVIIDSTKLKIEKKIRYDSEIIISKTGFQNLQKHHGILEEFLIQEAHPKSLTFLMDKNREKNFKAGFDRNFMSLIKNGYEDILSGNFLLGIEQIKGIGFGLTPSGDDFVCGVLCGLYLLQKGIEKDLSDLRNEIFQKARSANMISNNYLWLAKEGRFFEYLKEFLTLQTHPRSLSLRKRGEKKNSKSLESSKIPLFFKEGLGELKKIILTGETSGADMLTGFLITMKNFTLIH